MLSRETIQLIFSGEDGGLNELLNSYEQSFDEFRKTTDKVQQAFADIDSDAVSDTFADIEQDTVAAASEIETLTASIDANSEALQNSNAETTSFTARLGGIARGAVSLAADMGPLLALFLDFGPAAVVVGRANGPLGRIIGLVGAFRNPLLLAAGALTLFSAASAAFAQDLIVASAQTTVAVEELQSLEFQLSQLTAGANLEDLQQTLLNVSERFGEASRDAGGIRDALNSIGLSQNEIIELNFAGPEAQLEAIRESFQGLATDSERIFRARELFAEDGLRTLDFLTGQQRELDALEQRSIELGLVVPEQVIEDLNRLTNEYQVFGRLAENTAIQTGSIFTNVSTEAFGLVNDLFGLIGGPAGLGALLRGLTFPITKPVELVLKSSRFIVGIYEDLSNIIGQRVVGAVRSAAQSTDAWLDNLGRRTGIQDFFDGLATDLSKVNLRARLTAVNFQLLNDSLPDTEIQRLSQLQFDLEQGLAGTSEQARVLRDELIAQGRAAGEADEELGALIEQLAILDQDSKVDIEVEVTGEEKVLALQERIFSLRERLSQIDLSDDERSAANQQLEETQASIDNVAAIERAALEERRQQFAAGFNEIQAIQLQAASDREELEELFANRSIGIERERYESLLEAINTNEADKLAALEQAAADQVTAEEQRVQQLAEVQQNEINQAQLGISTLRESFDARLQITNQFARDLEQLQSNTATTGGTLDQSLVDQLEQRRDEALQELNNTELTEASNFDLLEGINVGDITNLDSTLSDIRDAVDEELQQIDNVSFEILPEAERNRQIAQAEALGEQLATAATRSFANAQNDAAFSASRFDSLGGLNFEGNTDLSASLQQIAVAARTEIQELEAALKIEAISQEDVDRQKALLGDLVGELRLQAQQSSQEANQALLSNAVDFSDFVNFDVSGATTANAANLSEQINQIFRDRLRAINLLSDAMLDPGAKSRLISDASDLKDQLQNELSVSVELDTFQNALGNIGEIGGAIGALQESALDDRNQRISDRAQEIQQVQADLNAAIESGNQREIDAQQQRLNALNGIQAQEQAQARRRFEAQKRTQQAFAIVNTISAAVQVFEETKGLGLFGRVAAMVGALSAGYAQVRAIGRQQFNSGSISGAGAAGGGAGGAGGDVSSNQVQAANQNLTQDNQQTGGVFRLELPAREPGRDWSQEEVDGLMNFIETEHQAGNYSSFEWFRATG